MAVTNMMWMQSASLRDVSALSQTLIMAMRLHVVSTRRAVDPVPLLVERLGNEARARHAMHIVMVVGSLWPDRFILSPPCCRLLSFDEHLIGRLVDWQQCDDRARFDADARDLLGDDAREQLWREFAVFAER
ncbi:MAG: hypothetical protein MUF41_02405 [Sphingopyxis sp.]|nr:hypothetical protein [Sphingopyxis sp.]